MTKYKPLNYNFIAISIVIFIGMIFLKDIIYEYVYKKELLIYSQLVIRTRYIRWYLYLTKGRKTVDAQNVLGPETRVS